MTDEVRLHIGLGVLDAVADPGLRTEVNDVRGGVPGVSDSGLAALLFRTTTRLTEKKELVILLKPTIIESDRVWAQDLRETEERINKMYPAQQGLRR